MKYDKELRKEVEIISEGTFEVHPQKGRYYKVKLFNDFKELDDYKIDYNYSGLQEFANDLNNIL